MGILLRGVERDEAERGMILASRGSIDLASRFRASLLLPSQEEGGPPRPKAKGLEVEVLIRTAKAGGKMVHVEYTVEPGERNSAEFALTSPVPVERGDRFVLVVGGQVAGAGRVEEVGGEVGDCKE